MPRGHPGSGPSRRSSQSSNGFPAKRDGTKRTPMDMVVEIANVGRQLSHFTNAFETVHSIQDLSSKNESIETYLGDDMEYDDNRADIMELSGEIKTIDSMANRGENIDITRLSDIYDDLSVNMRHIEKKRKKISSIRTECPLDQTQLAMLSEMASDCDTLPAKRMKTEDISRFQDDIVKMAISEKNKLIRILALATEIEREMTTSAFLSSTFQNIGDRWKAHCKGIMYDVSYKRELERTNMDTEEERRCEDMKEWFERNKKAVRVIISGCFCKHAMCLDSTSEEDKECYRELIEMCEREMSAMGETAARLLASREEPFGVQGADMPVFYNFREEFALRVSNDASRTMLFSKTPCIPVRLPRDDILLSTIHDLCENYGSNSRFYVPRIMGILSTGEEYVVIFEEVPHLLSSQMSEIRDSITEEDRYDMLSGLSFFLERAGKAKIKFQISHHDFRVTHSGKLSLHPSHFERISPRREGDRRTYNPDTVYRPNYNLFYGGIFIHRFFFDPEPQFDEQNNVMINPKRPVIMSPFAADMYSLMIKLYVPNDRMCNRNVESITRHLLHVSPPKRSNSIFSIGQVMPSSLRSYAQNYVRLRDESYMTGSVNLGRVNRKGDDDVRLKNYITKINAVSEDEVLQLWNFDLPEEKDTMGFAPCGALIKDFFQLALKHKTLELQGGVLVFCEKGSGCTACGTPEAPVKCVYYEKNDIFIALGRATRLAITMGVQWPHPMAHVTVKSIMNVSFFVNTQMCEDYFPMLKKISAEPDLLGPLSLMEDGSPRPFQLGDVDSPFDLPHTVDIQTMFPEMKVDLVVPMHLVSSYLIEKVNRRIHLTTRVSRAFRAGMGGTHDNSPSSSKFWKLVQNTPAHVMRELMSTNRSPIEYEAFMQKINFRGGFESEPEKIEWFKTIMGGDDAEQMRMDFLVATTEKTSLAYVKDSHITLSMSSKPRSTESGRPRVSETRVQVRACHGTMDVQYCWTLEDLRATIVGTISSGTELFTDV